MAANRSRSEEEQTDETHAPLLREMLCVLLEVGAHVEAHAAQLERMHARLERLDARASTRSAQTATVRQTAEDRPSRAPRRRPRGSGRRRCALFGPASAAR